MSKVYFMNNGDFDVRAMLTFGVSAKDNNEAIGFFGTGFKYAVAIILRLGGSIKITTKSGEFEFTSKVEQIRGKEFGMVHINDKDAGFTTHIGINWKPWMAFRELYCNAKDEHGEISDKVNTSFETIIEVDCEEIYKAYLERDKYFINTPIKESTRDVDIHERGDSNYIYYKGVAVVETCYDAAYSYNIKSPITPTEDRTVRYDFQVYGILRKSFQSLSNIKVIRDIVKNGKTFENYIGFDSTCKTTEEFIATCRQLLVTDLGVCDAAVKLLKELDDKNGDWPEFYLTKVQLQMLNKSKAFLEDMNIDVNLFPIKTVTGLGTGVLGRALDGVIYISDLAFQMGTKQLTSTLLEEWVHNKTGAEDFDRTMQNWLFDKILSIGEEINGEPL